MKKFLIIVACFLSAIAQVTASEQCRDEVFLRRAYLTITGAIPSAQESAKFLDDKRPNN